MQRVPKLKFQRALVLSLISLLLLFAACSEQRRAADSPTDATASASPHTAFSFPLPKNNMATSFNAVEKRWTTLDGKTTKLSDLGGKVVVMDFYATWCEPCRMEIPHLVALNGRYAKQGLQIVGLNVGGDEDRLQVPGFAKEYKINYQLGDPDAEMTELFFADDDTIPQTYVFDKRGRLLQRFIGYDPTMPDELESLVKNALADGTREISKR